MPGPPNIPEVSIVVPLTGGPRQALRCFEGIAQQEGPAYEVIVVDDASTGLQALLAQLEGDVEVVRSERRGGFCAAAALGVEHARGRTIALIREGAVPRRGWLGPLVAAVEDPAVGLAASITETVPAASPVGALALAMRRDELARTGMPREAEELAVSALELSLAQRGLRIVTVAQSVVAAPGTGAGEARYAGRLGESPELTVVIPTLDACSGRLRRCVAAVQSTTEASHQIVIVDNGSPPQGFTAPVNAGLRGAESPYAVVMNDDVEPLPGWWQPLRAALDEGASVAFPLTVEGGMRLDFAAWCFAVTEIGIREFGHGPGEFFDPSMLVWYQDTDLLRRLREQGRPPVLVERSRIRHGLSATVASEDPHLRAWIGEQIASDRERFLAKHPEARLEGHTLTPA